MPVIIRNIRGIDIDPKITTKDITQKQDMVIFTEDDRQFLDALKEFYTLGKSDLLDLYHNNED